MAVSVHSGRETPVRFDPEGAEPAETTGTPSKGKTIPHRRSPPNTRKVQELHPGRHHPDRRGFRKKNPPGDLGLNGALRGDGHERPLSLADAGPQLGRETWGISHPRPGNRTASHPNVSQGIPLEKETFMASRRGLEDRFAFGSQAVHHHRLRRPVLEVLEGRALLATFTVNSLGIRGACRAREPARGARHGTIPSQAAAFTVTLASYRRVC